MANITTLTERENVKFNPKAHHRRSIRLKGYDYSRVGAYFVTICAQNKLCLFGDIVDGRMVLNNGGRMVQTVWDELPKYYPSIETDTFQIMPNHIHGIIVIVGASPCACPDPRPGTNDGQPRVIGQPRGVAPTLSLPDVVHRFKTMTTKRYADGAKKNGWPPFPRKLWQRNYYEHIIRNESDLNLTRKYIIENPKKWEFDRENPNSVRPHA